jgi:hypothetical protein
MAVPISPPEIFERSWHQNVAVMIADTLVCAALT